MGVTLTPREIQARIRAGQSVDELAADTGMTTSEIEPFAGPVLAERSWFASQASRGLVRRDGVSTHQSLLDLIGDRLANRGLSTADVNWDAWRGHDRLWTLRASFRSGSALHEAVFRYDPAGRFSTAVNDEARWLIGEASAAVVTPQPDHRTASHNADIDSEPTLDLSVTHHIGAPTDDFEPGDFMDAELTQVNGVYDLMPGSSMDVLYDMLASINEESVRIYDGLTGGSGGASKQSRKTAATTKPALKPKLAPAKPEPEPEQVEELDLREVRVVVDEAKEPTTRIPKSKKRVIVPTWDEIMFGSPSVS